MTMPLPRMRQRDGNRHVHLVCCPFSSTAAGAWRVHCQCVASQRLACLAISWSEVCLGHYELGKSAACCHRSPGLSQLRELVGAELDAELDAQLPDDGDDGGASGVCVAVEAEETKRAARQRLLLEDCDGGLFEYRCLAQGTAHLPGHLTGQVRSNVKQRLVYCFAW
jgi:hypothetical protein